MQSRILSFLLILVTNIKIVKTNTNISSYFFLVDDSLRYNKLFSHGFNM